MKIRRAILAIVLALYTFPSAFAQDAKAGNTNEGKPPVAHETKMGKQYSGMYSF